jgi:hypothetical protein
MLCYDDQLYINQDVTNADRFLCINVIQFRKVLWIAIFETPCPARDRAGPFRAGPKKAYPEPGPARTRKARAGPRAF